MNMLCLGLCILIQKVGPAFRGVVEVTYSYIARVDDEGEAQLICDEFNRNKIDWFATSGHGITGFRVYFQQWNAAKTLILHIQAEKHLKSVRVASGK